MTEILKRIPRFVLFGDSFANLPAQIACASARNDPTVGAFAEMAGLDLKELEAMKREPRRRKGKLRRGEDRTNALLKDYLEHVRLVVDGDGDELFFSIPGPA